VASNPLAPLAAEPREEKLETERRREMPATARAVKPKAQKGSTEPVSAKTVSEIGERLRALIGAKVGEKPMLRRHKIGHQTVDDFLASKSPIRIDGLETMARLLDTTPAALLAEALGSAALVVMAKLLEQLVPTLKWWQKEVEKWRREIVPSPREDAMLEHEEEQDLETELRALLECISKQHLAGTIKAAQEMANWHPKEKK
jgi:hypothetical protein